LSDADRKVFVVDQKEFEAFKTKRTIFTDEIDNKDEISAKRRTATLKIIDDL
jgi:hypothetical protein